jgi:hypothetical protein
VQWLSQWVATAVNNRTAKSPLAPIARLQKNTTQPSSAGSHMPLRDLPLRSAARGLEIHYISVASRVFAAC